MSILSALSFDTRKISNESLRRFNAAVASLLFLQAVALILVSPANASRPIQTSFLAQDAIASQSTGHRVLLDATHHLGDINPTYLAAVSLLLAAASYLAAATFRRSSYQRDLTGGTNNLRWLAYALSGALMFVATSLFLGVGELGLLLAIALACASVCLMAAANERSAGSKSSNGLGLATVSAAGSVPILVPAVYLWGAYFYGSVPSVYQYASFIVLVIYVVVIARLSLGAKVPAKDYARRDRNYSLAHLIGMSALAWLIFAGLR